MILEHEERTLGQAGRKTSREAHVRGLPKLAGLSLGPSPINSTLGGQLRQGSRLPRFPLLHEPPRPIRRSGPKKSGVVIFTDGSAPSSSPKDPSTEMIGGVMFTRDDLPRQSGVSP